MPKKNKNENLFWQRRPFITLIQKVKEESLNMFFSWFDSLIVKRRISLKTIKAITMSSKSDEFVVHVEDDYDYLYLSEK